MTRSNMTPASLSVRSIGSPSSSCSKGGPQRCLGSAEKNQSALSRTFGRKGYFDRLESTGITAAILDPAEIEYAYRNPPSGTPATVRGRYIREFAGGEPILVNWQRIYLGSGRNRREIDLAASRPLAPPASPTPTANRGVRIKGELRDAACARLSADLSLR